MTIAKGERLPAADMLRVGEDGPEAVALGDLASGKRIAVFGVPGAFTGTCTTAHLPSFIRTKDQFAEKGVDTVICVSVNDPFVMKAWGQSTGADKAGIHMLADSDGAFTKALGLEFDAPPAGLFGRSKRYAMLVDDGEVRSLHVEESPGVCEATAGENLLKDA